MLMLEMFAVLLNEELKVPIIDKETTCCDSPFRAGVGLPYAHY